MKEWMLTSSVLILLVLAVRYLFKNKMKAKYTYALWLIVLVRLLCPVNFGELSFNLLSLAEEGKAQLEEHLESHYRAELSSLQCLTGPHKDDFIACINGLSVASFASQGQTRTATISLKLAERELLRRDREEEPLLLLDDVLSELDAGRQDFVLNQLKSGQVFITCCETDRWTRIGQVLRVENGSLL